FGDKILAGWVFERGAQPGEFGFGRLGQQGGGGGYGRAELAEVLHEGGGARVGPVYGRIPGGDGLVEVPVPGRGHRAISPSARAIRILPRSKCSAGVKARGGSPRHPPSVGCARKLNEDKSASGVLSSTLSI